MPIVVEVNHEPNQYLSLKPQEYSEPFRQLMRAMPGSKWEQGNKRYLLPLEAFPIIRNTAETSQIALFALPVDTMLATAMADNNHSNPDLYPYQRQGVRFIDNALENYRAVILADEMGLGKSAQALRGLASNQALIICPAVVKQHWKEQVKRWTSYDATILTVKNVEFYSNGYGIITWDALRNWVDKFGRRVIWNVIADELQYASHRGSKRSKAFKHLITTANTEPFVVGLSGTPMETRPRDLWSPLDALFPGRFGSYFSYAARYCDGHKEDVPGVGTFWTDAGASHLDELRTRLEPLMLRRTKASVLDLPSRVRTVLPVELPPTALKAYRYALDGANLRDGREIGRVLSLIEGHKIPYAIEQANLLVEAGHRPLILVTRKETGRAIAKALGCPYVDGEVDARKRRDKLLSGGGAAVATIFSVTTGIDLTEFDAEVFVGLDWVPSRIRQVEDRIHRIGQWRSVSIYYIVGLNTLDEVIRSTVIERLQTFEAIVGNAPDERALAEELRGATDEEILQSIIEMATSTKGQPSRQDD